MYKYGNPKTQIFLSRLGLNKDTKETDEKIEDPDF